MEIYNTNLWIWILLIISLIFLFYTIIRCIKDKKKDKKINKQLNKPKILAEDEPVIYDLGKTEEIKEEKEDGK